MQHPLTPIQSNDVSIIKLQTFHIEVCKESHSNCHTHNTCYYINSTRLISWFEKQHEISYWQRRELLWKINVCFHVSTGESCGLHATILEDDLAVKCMIWWSLVSFKVHEQMLSHSQTAKLCWHLWDLSLITLLLWSVRKSFRNGILWSQILVTFKMHEWQHSDDWMTTSSNALEEVI